MEHTMSRMHGCACGARGYEVTRRPIGNKPTRHREVDVEHSESGTVHTNVVKFGEPMTLKDGSRWVPFNQR